MSGPDAFELTPSVAWTATSLLLGVQAAATAGRAMTSNEVASGADRDPFELPPCEWINLASIVYSVVGVFIIPTLSRSLAVMETAFGVYLLLYAGYPLAVLAHADERFSLCTALERDVITGLCVAICIYLVAAVLTAGEAGVGAAMCVAFVTVPVCVLFVTFVWKAQAGDVDEDVRRVRLDIHGRRVESARGRGRYGRARGSMVGAQAGDLSLSPRSGRSRSLSPVL